jgi:hypothetical protein
MPFTRPAFALLLAACSESGLHAFTADPTAGRPGTPTDGVTAPDPDRPDPKDPATTDPDPTDPTTTTPDTTTPDPQVCWWEPMDTSVSVSDVRSGFRSATALDDALEVMDRRWPAGSGLLREMSHDPYIDVFLEESSWSAMMDSLMTVVHEETHGYDYEHSIHPTRFSLYLQENLTLEMRWIDGFPRSRIADRVEGNSTDLYDSLYLEGTQGTYGFAELLDETNCYINGLGGAVAGWDAIPYTMSASDGPLAFLYFIALYLEEAQDSDPRLYQDLQNDPDVHEILEAFWLRTHFFLEYSDPVPELGIEDQRIRTLLYQHQQTWEDFLGEELDASPCLP